MDHLLSLFKALSDETRLRLIVLLAKQDYCVCEITEILNLSQPKVSKHLSKLKDLGFVKARRDAQYIYYQLSVDDQALKNILTSILANINNYPVLAEDLKRISQCTIINQR